MIYLWKLGVFACFFSTCDYIFSFSFLFRLLAKKTHKPSLLSLFPSPLRLFSFLSRTLFFTHIYPLCVAMVAGAPPSVPDGITDDVSLPSDLSSQSRGEANMQGNGDKTSRLLQFYETKLFM